MFPVVMDKGQPHKFHQNIVLHSLICLNSFHRYTNSGVANFFGYSDSSLGSASSSSFSCSLCRLPKPSSSFCTFLAKTRYAVCPIILIEGLVIPSLASM